MKLLTLYRGLNFSLLSFYYVKLMKILYNYISILFFIISLIIGVSASIYIKSNHLVIIEWNVEIISRANFNLPFILDKPGLLFSSTVLFISANVLLFSNSYIKDEKENSQFLILIILFILSINILIFTPNILFLLLGWDGLGLVSFLLVIHYPSPKSLAAGYITVITNRIGDALIIISIPLIFSSLRFTPTILLKEKIDLLVILLILAAITKRAQIPFSSWLPAAIAAPTPISALVHSSTLVTAGVFLIYRFYPTLSISHYYTLFLLISATLTILIAGFRAFKETDIKKIIALSTLSQLGVIIFTLAINLPELAYFHILSHATFKALLFIAAGNLILQSSHTQDLRQFGSLYFNNPITLSSLIISNLRLVGFPFIAGFFSKDLIIEIVVFNKINLVIFIILIIATIITLVYSSRFIYSLIYSNNNNKPLNLTSSRDKNINFRLLIITSFVIIRGAYLIWNLSFPYIHPSLTSINKFIVINLLLFRFFIIFILTLLNIFNKPSLLKFEFTRSIWFISFFNSQWFLSIFKGVGFHLFKKVDRGWGEIILGRSLSLSISNFSSYYLKWQYYIISINFFLLLIIFIFSSL